MASKNRRIDCSFVLLCLFCSFGLGEMNSAHDTPGAYPGFLFAKRIKQCTIDSPEIFYETVALRSLTSSIDEGKIFFGILMDKLESSLVDEEIYEKLEKEWSFLLGVITESFDLALIRISDAWETIINHNHMQKLPWEVRIGDLFFMELFTGLQNQYRIVESVMRAGTKEIVSTLQTYLIEVMQKLEDKIFTESSETPKSEKEILKRMENAVNILEPNFIGKLLTKILKRMRDPDFEYVKSSLSFLEDSMQEIAITTEAYRTRGKEFPFFWTEMTLILRGTNNTTDQSSEQLFQMYMTDEELVIDAVIHLLAHV